MKMAPLSSRKLEMRPLSNAVKNVSGMQVSVCRDVENLEKIKHQTLYSFHRSKRLSLKITHFLPPTLRLTMSPPPPVYDILVSAYYPR